MFNKVFSLIKKVIKEIMKIIKGAIKIATKNPIYTVIACVAGYFIYTSINGKGGDILKEIVGAEPEQEQAAPEPESDDVSMYQDSQEFTAAIADRDSKVEDLVIEAHA